MSRWPQAPHTRPEQGQTLVLFAFFIVILVLFVMIVVDVGFFFNVKSKAQSATDAAALAGAQKLPDDPAGAAAIARDYMHRNGLDSGTAGITFKCTSTLVQLCNPSQNRYDTIVVNASSDAPSFFGGALSLVGNSSCWSSGCSASVVAAACRGACGGASTPVDAVVTIDHTGSMNDVDLQNAKDGALELMRTFDSRSQNVALGVTPPVHPNNLCDTIESWTDAQTWVPVPLTSNYQTSPHVLNMSSPLVATTECMDRAASGDVPGPHTNLGEPVKAAMDELRANGRAGANLGLVLETDGAANIVDAANAAAVGALGPCDYAMKMASQAKAARIEIFTLGYGVDENCTHENANSPWANRPAVDLLRAMATDSAHFFNAPKTADLDPIFQAIGQQLAGGSRLVQ